MLDLGVAVPTLAIAAVRLRKRRAWGYVFTGVLLVMAATLGGAVLAMAFFMGRDGQPVPMAQIVAFGALTLASAFLLVRLLSVIGPRTGGPDGIRNGLRE